MGGDTTICASRACILRRCIYFKTLHLETCILETCILGDCKSKKNTLPRNMLNYGQSATMPADLLACPTGVTKCNLRLQRSEHESNYIRPEGPWLLPRQRAVLFYVFFFRILS